MCRSILVLGIGNTLLSDEGVGVHVVNHLARTRAGTRGLEFVDGGTLSFTLAEPIAAHQGLIVVDAARWGQPPGTTRCVEGKAMDDYLGTHGASVHEVGLVDLLKIARLSDGFPRRRALIGIEPQSLDWGSALSDCVAASIATAETQVMDLYRRWYAQPA